MIPLFRWFYKGVSYGNTPGGGFFYGYCVPQYVFHSSADSVLGKDGLNGSVSGTNRSSSVSGIISPVSNGTTSLYAPCSFDTNGTGLQNGSVCNVGSLCFVPTHGRNSMEDTTAVGVCVPTDMCDPTAWDYESYYYYSYDDSATKGACTTCRFLHRYLIFVALVFVVF